MTLERTHRTTKKSYRFTVGSPKPLHLLGSASAIFLLTMNRLSEKPVGLFTAFMTAMIALWLVLPARASRLRVEIGTDGLRLRRATGDRFISYADVERLEPIRGASRRHQGIRFKPRGEPEERWFALWIDAAFLEAVQHAMAKHGQRLAERAQQGDPTGPRILAATTGDDYRQAAYPTDVLVRIAEDPTEHLGARLAATRALRGRPDLAEHARFRVAAKETASEALRGELEELAADENAVRRETRG